MTGAFFFAAFFTAFFLAGGFRFFAAFFTAGFFAALFLAGGFFFFAAFFTAGFFAAAFGFPAFGAAAATGGGGTGATGVGTRWGDIGIGSIHPEPDQPISKSFIVTSSACWRDAPRRRTARFARAFLHT